MDINVGINLLAYNRVCKCPTLKYVTKLLFYNSCTNLYCDLGLIEPVVRPSLQDLVLSDRFEHGNIVYVNM